MVNDKLEIKKITKTWYIGRGLGVTFFGHSATAVALKFWDYKHNKKPPIPRVKIRPSAIAAAMLLDFHAF